MQFILILLVVFMGAAILSRLARDLWIMMAKPPTYYEGRDWFDEDKLRDDPFDEMPLYRLDRLDYEEEME